MVGSISQLASTPVKTQQRLSIETTRIDQQSAREVYSIVYTQPGKVGFCLPRISTDAEYCQYLVESLQAEALVRKVQINRTAGSVEVSYKTGAMSDFEMRSHLISAIHSAGNSVKIESVLNQTQTAKVDASIAFAIPGQVGFCIPRMSEDQKYCRRLVELLKAETGIQQVQVNPTAGSILVIYKSESKSDQQMRSHLSNLIQSASNTSKPKQPVKIEPTFSPPTIKHRQDKEKSKPEDKEKFTPLLQSSYTHANGKFAGNGKASSGYQPQENLPAPSSSLPAITPPAKTDAKAKQPAKVAYSIAHAIPGRIRFHVPRIAQDPKYVKRLEALLKADPTVIGERINRSASSIVITYKSAFKQKSNAVEAAISHLANLLQDANDVGLA